MLSMIPEKYHSFLKYGFEALFTMFNIHFFFEPENDILQLLILLSLIFQIFEGIPETNKINAALKI